MVHLLFEQSGVFKNAFKSLGCAAIDYDISNLFGNTDIVIDLFKEIDFCNDCKKSIFDGFKKDDLVIAFFPCIRFERNAFLHYLCNEPHIKNKSLKEKILYNSKYVGELFVFYNYFKSLVSISLIKGFPLIIENFYCPDGFLFKYWFDKPKVVHTNRTLYGDYFVKPTAYWFYNIEPLYKQCSICDNMNFVFRTVNNSYGINRSLMSDLYAINFIKMHIDYKNYVGGLL